MWRFTYSYHLRLQLWNSPKDPVLSKPSINCQGVRSRMQARWKRRVSKKGGRGCEPLCTSTDSPAYLPICYFNTQANPVSKRVPTGLRKEAE